MSNTIGESLIVEQGGCIVVVDYVYDPLTEYLMKEYEKANNPQPERITKAWDYVIKDLKNRSASTYFIRFEVTDDGTGNPQTEYLLNELVGTTILAVEIEGQSINESDPMTVHFNPTTGLLTFSIGLTIDQYIKVTYKK